MTDFSDRLAALSPEQRALFELRRKQKGLRETQDQPIPRRAPAPHYPLSFDQLRLWFLYQFAPDNAAYNINGGVRLTGLLDRDLLERSINEIIRRHEILRTTFTQRVPAVDGQPVQLIAPRLTITVEQADLSRLSPQEQAAALPKLATQYAQKPFDLQHGPLIRATLLRLAPDDHVLLTTMHHIVTDRWSYALFEQELAVLYHAFSNRLPSPLPELPIQFADFAIWQQQWMHSEKMQAQLAYWTRRLADLPPIHQLPTDHPRPAVLSYRGARQPLELDPSAVAGITALSRQSGTTVFITLLALFMVLLARQSEATDIVVSTPIANRDRPELARLIGFFLNTLIFRADLSGNPTFRAYLTQMRQRAGEAYANQDVPFERLVAELRPERDTSRNPLFQISFLFLDFEETQELNALSGVQVKAVDIDPEDARFDLTLALWSKPDRIAGFFEYSTDLFEAATIAVFAEHFKLLTASIIADPDQRVFDIPCLTDHERQRLLIDQNATAAAYPQDRCVHQLIEDQAGRTPDAVAVVFGDQSLTYAELNGRANQLAHHLRALGVGTQSQAEVRVGLYLHRSLELVIALLGILKAGGAYVPLDPTYPTARLEFMVADAQIDVLVTQQALMATSPRHEGITLCLDHDWPQIAQQPTSTPPGSVGADHLAYVIYTSGSTGQPKGVQIPHRALTNFLHAMRQVPGMEADDTLLAVTTIAFDIAGLELFLPLLVGARLVLVSRAEATDGARLAALIDTTGATVLQATPATWRILLATGWAGTPRLRALSGGEALSWDLAEALLERVDQLWNLYGPTETTIWSAATRVRREDRRISLGQPIANTQLYVLDRQQCPVPLAAPGELYIGGHGLARGYLNRPALTAEKFVPNPFTDSPGERLYRTGDVARHRADGTIEFLGRIDHQVKVRGYRIELGEIEAVLRQQAQIRDAVVVVREDRTPTRGHPAGGPPAGGHPDQRLVAYMVGAQANQEQPAANRQSINTEQIRAYLRERLPEYMVPSAFVTLDALPLTANGKLDRRALPAPDRAEYDGILIAPRTPTEELIAGVWSEVLGVHPIGVHDNFFALGGHSLLVTQVVGRLKQILHLDLPLRLLFEAPTIATFAARLTDQQTAATMPLRAVPRDGTPLPLSFAQQRLWFLDQLEPGSAAYNLLTAVRLLGALDLTALQRSLTAIVQRHESLRTTFTQHLGEPVQVIRPASDVTLPVVALRDVPEIEQQAALMRIVRDEAQRPFDLKQGPLLRAQIAEVSNTEHVLLLTLHHIVTDGWSQGILVRELAALYQGSTHNQPVKLPELPIQYADYAVWQREWLQATVLEQQIDYWRQQLANLSPLDLPTDYSRPPILSYHGAHMPFQIPAALSADLHHLSQQLGSTLFMTLLAAFQALLARYSGQADIAVGTPIAGRVRPELEDLIGFFVNTLVLRTDLSNAPSFAEAVDRVRTVCLQAYAHQDLPFEALVERLQPQRDLSRTPLFQIMFALQNLPSTSINLPDLTLEPIAAESATAQFDLSMTLVETSSGLQGQVEYRADLFTAETIARMVRHFQTLLAAIVAEPHQRIDRLPLLTATERQQVLERGAKPFPVTTDLLVSDLIAAQVVQRPEQIAVQWQDQRLTYQELDRQANQLAHHLQTLGVGPDTIVGVCVERSPRMVVALLAVLKAGGAYLPLDPAYPQERLHFMLHDARAAVLLTEAAFLDPASTQLADSAATIVCLDRDADRISRQPERTPHTCAQPDHLMYVIYTSGSTGTPKGVMIAHRSLVNYIQVVREHYTVEPTDRVLQFASISFDASVEELFVPLVNGATLVLRSEEMLASPAAFAAACDQQRITVLSLPTAFWHVLVEASANGSFVLPTSIRLIIMGGEQAALTRLRQWQTQHGTRTRLVNLYGPTETTIAATADVVPPTIPDTQPETTIGTTLANVQTYVLDQELQPVPDGVAGELYLGGAGLARGYLYRPEVTAERFVPDPFAGHPGARLYRTGDRVRVWQDGRLLFLGRVDQQIKLRGYRIELGEIEAVLRGHPAVQEAVVVLREDHPGDQRLVAYVVPAAATSPDHQQLQHFLSTRLPAYMLPTAFVALDTLPLTPSDKVDRNALPTPDAERLNERAAFVAPRTPTEAALVGIWQELLRLEQISIHDNFFALGGHSLLATQVLASIRDQFHVELMVRTLFEYPTIAGLSQQIDAARWSLTDQPATVDSAEEEEEWEI